MKSRLLITSAALVLFVSFNNCASVNDQDSNQLWLNTKFVSCLKERLPCDCEKETQEYYSLVLNLQLDKVVSMSKYEFMEPYQYPLRQKGSDEYVILSSNSDSTIWGKLILRDDKLNLVVDGITAVFERFEISEESNGDLYSNAIVDILNRAFIKRGFETLHDLLGEKALHCNCNKWMGGVDQIYVPGQPKSWILEINVDSLEISKILNTDRDPDDPVQTQKMKSFKW